MLDQARALRREQGVAVQHQRDLTTPLVASQRRQVVRGARVDLVAAGHRKQDALVALPALIDQARHTRPSRTRNILFSLAFNQRFNLAGSSATPSRFNCAYTTAGMWAM